MSDAHHNKVLGVSTDGAITEMLAVGNVVPAGLDVWGDEILLALTGPAPHLPADGQIVSFGLGGEPALVAAGGPLMLDVERGRGSTLFGLAQGFFTPGQPDGAPAEPDTGELLAVHADGSVSVVVGGLDRPTSMEIIGDTAFVVGLSGDIVRIDDIGHPNRSHH